MILVEPEEINESREIFRQRYSFLNRTHLQFFNSLSMSTQFSLKLDYAHIHTTSPNQKKQIINKFQKVLFLGEGL